MTVLLIAVTWGMIKGKSPMVAAVLGLNWLATRGATAYGGDLTLELVALSDFAAIIALALIRTKLAGTIAILFMFMLIGYWLAFYQVISISLMWSIAEILGYAQIFLMVFYGMVNGRGFYFGANRHRHFDRTLDL